MNGELHPACVDTMVWEERWVASIGLPKGGTVFRLAEPALRRGLEYQKGAAVVVPAQEIVEGP